MQEGNCAGIISYTSAQAISQTLFSVSISKQQNSRLRGTEKAAPPVTKAFGKNKAFKKQSPTDNKSCE